MYKFMKNKINFVRLGQICQNSEAKVWKPALPSSPCALFSDKVRCVSESSQPRVRVLYGSFID